MTDLHDHIGARELPFKSSKHIHGKHTSQITSTSGSTLRNLPDSTNATSTNYMQDTV